MKNLINQSLKWTLLLIAPFAIASVSPGDKAPDFDLKGHDGKSYKLSQVLDGKTTVVLEWFNNECPYVEKHYGTGNMQKLQTTYTGKGVKWFSVISSAEGKQGYRDAASATATRNERKQTSTAVLLDPSGEVGKAYGAKTTPHMYVINKEGSVVYAGAIDDNPSFQKDTVAGAKNYVVAALDATLAGKEVEENSTKAYGCSVKY